MSVSVVAHIDGGSRGNPGPAAAGVVVSSADDGTVLFEGGYYLGRATNNVAEYQGLLRALDVARRLGADEVSVRSDSELMVRQMNGQYRVKNAKLKPLFEKANEAAAALRRFDIRHVRREQNAHADRLANQAMNLQRNVEDAGRS